MVSCKYEYQEDGYTNYKCVEESWKDSDYCILHMDFPADEKSPEFRLISEEKRKKTNEKIINNDFDFTGAKLWDIKLQGANIKGGVIFSGAIIEGGAYFSDATIWVADFIGTTFHGSVDFRRAKIMDANFSNANFIDSIINFCNIEMSDIKGRLFLKGAKFKLLRNEEDAYKKAKRLYESLGDKNAADEHYYI